MKFLLLLLLVGCTTTTVETPMGWKLSRTSVMQQIQILKMTVDTNGTFSLDGYKTDGGTAAAAIIGGAIAEGAVRGAKKP